MDPLSIISILSQAIPALSKLTEQQVTPSFLSQEEYESATQEYRLLDKARKGNISTEEMAYLISRGVSPISGKQGIERRMLELAPSLKQWEAKSERESFRKAGVEENLRRLGVTEERGVRNIIEGMYGRGLRGEGEIYRPVGEFKERVGETRADILRGEAGQAMVERQQQEASQMEQQYGQWGAENELWGQAASLGLGTIGEFRPGGAFGGPSESQKMYEDLLKSQSGQNKALLNQYQKQGLLTKEENLEYGFGPSIYFR